MQESECFTGGAALVISVGGLNWLPQRRGSDTEVKKRGEELDWWMTQADRRPAAGIRALDRGGSDAIESLRKTNHRPRLASPCRLPKELFQPSACVPPDPFIRWMEFTVSLPDASSLIPVRWNTAAHQDRTAQDPCESFIVYCDDQTPALLFRDISSGLHLDRPFRGGMSVELKDTAAQWTPGPSPSPEDHHSDPGVPDHLNGHSHRGLLKSSQDHGRPRRSGGKLRKSVSFDDDVMVYLFDRERPTLELQPEATLTSNYSCNLQGFTVKDNGLEWEDDFSALEKSRHLQCARPAGRRSLHLPPERCPPSQRCLFLTYVTEADLEL